MEIFGRLCKGHDHMASRSKHVLFLLIPSQEPLDKVLFRNKYFRGYDFFVGTLIG